MRGSVFVTGPLFLFGIGKSLRGGLRPLLRLNCCHDGNTLVEGVTPATASMMEAVAQISCVTEVVSDLVS